VEYAVAETTLQLKGAYLNRYRGFDKTRSVLDAGAERRPEGVRTAEVMLFESIPTTGMRKQDSVNAS
jgi:hypothetical protein